MTFHASGDTAPLRTAPLGLPLLGFMQVQNFDLSLEAGAVLPEPVVDIALKPITTLRVRFTRRQASV